MVFFNHIKRPALLPFLPFYAFAVYIRNLLFDLKILRSTAFNFPVISIGNITVGGTGKTPHVEFICRLLKNEFKIAVLSRGYKRKTRGFFMVTDKSRVNDVGDEPLQIRQKFNDVLVAVHDNRVAGIRTLIHNTKKPDIILLDDAFQHRYVKAGLSILLIDYTNPVFTDVLLPAGNLREPGSGMVRADIIIITKCPPDLTLPAQENFISQLNRRPKQQVFFSRYQYGGLTGVFHGINDPAVSLPWSKLQNERVSVMLLTGISNPTPMKLFIGQYVRIAEEIHYPDHHYFNEKDFRYVQSKFEDLKTKERYIIITEKDAVRIREAGIKDENFRKAFYYLPIEVKFLSGGEVPFKMMLNNFLKSE